MNTKVRTLSLIGLGLSTLVPGAIIGNNPGGDWRLTMFVYGIATGMFVSVLWLLMLDWHLSRNSGALSASTAASAQNDQSGARAPRASAERAPAGKSKPAAYTVPVPRGVDAASAVIAYAERLGMQAYRSAKTGAFYLYDGAHTYTCRVVQA